jgi:hypothetical protein
LRTADEGDAGPVVHQGKVYTLGAIGHLFCFNAESGKVIWSREFKKDYGIETPLWGFSAHPLIDGQELICLVGGEGSTVVAAFQVGRFANGGSSDIGWSRSTNDGVSWTHGFLPGLTTFEAGGTYASESDPTVAYDKAHDVWMITSLGLYPGPTPGTFANEGDVVTSRSVDGGATWQNPVMIGGNGALALDKPWVICDNTVTSPYYGHCYATYDDFLNHGQVSMSTSTDGGVTWSTPIATRDGQRGLGGVPVVQSNGRVVVPLLGPVYMDTFSSTDGGTTWNGTTHISKVHFFTPSVSAESYLRSDPLPSAAIDSHDRIFVVWSDCRFATNCRRNDVVMSTSDNGTKWTPVKRVPLDGLSARETFAGPSIATDPATAGKHTALALTTYAIPHPSCSDSSCNVVIDFASSRDRGNLWTRAGQIEAPMNLTWSPATTGGCTRRPGRRWS